MTRTPTKGGGQWERQPGSEPSAEKEKEEEEDVQEFSSDKDKQEAPGAGYGQL